MVSLIIYLAITHTIMCFIMNIIARQTFSALPIQLFFWQCYLTESSLLVLNAIQPVRLSARLIKILSHYELIPDAALTSTLTRNNEIQSQSKKYRLYSIEL